MDRNYQEQGGARTVICGEIDIVSGGKFKVAGVDRTAALATANIISRGETALGGTNPTDVVTGLATVAGFSLALKGSAAPGVGTTTLTYTVSGGTVSVYAWKPTSNSDPTLIASTGTETFGWIAIGT
jgi:hypothetical protein